MPPPTPAAPQELLARVDTLIKKKDDLLKSEFPDGKIGPEEQQILDRIAEKLDRLVALAGQAAGGNGSIASSISGSVGRGGKNKPEDTETIQQLLNQSGANLVVDGVVGPKTIGAIDAYQKKTFGWNDGLVEVDKQTWAALTGRPIPAGGDPSGTSGETSGSIANSISGSVGRGGDNAEEDVMTIQQLLNRAGASLTEDGMIGPKTIGAISAYQKKTFGWSDGLVEVDNVTWAALTGRPAPADAGASAGSGASGGGGGGHTSEPTLVEADPTDPEDMDQLVEEQLECLPEPDATVDITDENGDVLAFPEFPFVRGQEISVGINLGGMAEGELKIKFNDRGQVEAVAVGRPIIPGAAIGSTYYGIMCRGEVKPFSCEMKLKKTAGELVCELELSTSGAIICGLGLARGQSWAGLGVEVELKVARTEKLTATLALDMVEQAIRGMLPGAGLSLDFPLPATVVMSGAQNFIIGGSADAKAAGASIASKINLEDYNPMIILTISDDDVSISAEDGLRRMIMDHMRYTMPMLDLAIEAYEMAQEIREMIEDPEAYSARKRAEAEEFLRRAQAFPTEVRDLIQEELDKLAKLDSEIARQMEEWGEEANRTIAEIRAEAERRFSEVEDDILEIAEGVSDVAGGIADDVMDALDAAGDSASEMADDLREAGEDLLQDAEDLAAEQRRKIEEARAAAEDMAEEMLEDAEELWDSARESASDAIDGISETANDVREDIEEAADSVRETAENAIDAAESAADQAGDAMRQAGDALIDAAEDVRGEIADQANDAVEAAESAAEALEEAADQAQEAIGNAAEDMMDEAEDLLDDAGDAVDNLREEAENRLRNIFD